MDSSPTGWIQIGPCRLNLAQGRLQREGSTRELSLGEVAALTLLLAEPGALVERATLIEHLMPDGDADQDALDQLMDALRRALGDSLLHPRVIQRVGRKGYRWIAGQPSEALSDEDTVATPTDQSAETAALPRAGERAEPMAADADEHADAEFAAVAPPRTSAGADPSAASTPVPDFLSRVRGHGARLIAPPSPRSVAIMSMVVLAVAWFGRPREPEPLPTGLPGFYTERPLEIGDRLEQDSSISSDGRLLVHALIERGQTDLWALDTLTLAHTPIAQTPTLETEPVLALGNRMLAFTRRTSALAAPSVWLRDLDSGEETLLRRLARSPRFAPTGDAVVYIAEQGDNTRSWIEIIELSDGVARALPGTEGARAVEWSASGWELAFLREDGVFVLKLPDGLPQRVVQESHDLLDFAWELDSRHLLLAWPQGSGSLLQRISIKPGAEPRTLWEGQPGVRSLSVSATRAITLSLGERRGLLSHDSNEGALSAYPRVTGDVREFSPPGDGSSLILRVAEDPAQPAQLVRLEASTGRATRLVVPADCGYGAQVSPDGSEIAYTCLRGENAGLWRMNIDDGTRQRVATPFYPTGTSRAAWTPNGRALVHADAIINGIGGIWLLPLDTGLPKRLSDARATSLAVSPDGRLVAACVIASNTRQLWLHSARGDSGRKLADSCSEQAAPLWAPDSRSLSILQKERSAPELVRIGIDGDFIGEPDRLLTAPATDSLGVFDWAEHGDQRILFEIRARSTLLLLEPGTG